MGNTESLTKTVSRRVRVAMVERDISGSELARRVGMKQPYLSRRLNGTVEFRVGELKAIAIALDMPLADLLPEPEPAGDTR